MLTPGSPKVVQGRYEIVDEQMRCRFSTLYRAIDQLTRAPVVLRRLHTPAVPNESKELAKDQFMKEGRVLRRLVHRNLPRVLDAVDHEGEFYIVMESFEGQTLDQVASQLSGRPSEQLLYRWMDQVASALEYLHGQDPPVIYRDLRPQTVVMTPSAVIKLVDFGLARMVEDMSRDRTAFRGRGATNYAAPEQFGSSPSNPRMDLYALGATFYFLGSGKVPPAAWDRSYSGSTLPEIRRENPAITPAFEAFIGRLMSLYPKDRPPTAREVRQEISLLCPTAVDTSETEMPAADEVPTVRPAQRPEPGAPPGIRKPGTSSGSAVRMRTPSSLTGRPAEPGPSPASQGEAPAASPVDAGRSAATTPTASQGTPPWMSAARPPVPAPPSAGPTPFLASAPPPAGPAAAPQPVPPTPLLGPATPSPVPPPPPPAPSVAPLPAAGFSPFDTLAMSRPAAAPAAPAPPPVPDTPPSAGVTLDTVSRSRRSPSPTEAAASPPDVPLAPPLPTPAESSAVPTETVIGSAAILAARDAALAQAAAQTAARAALQATAPPPAQVEAVSRPPQAPARNAEPDVPFVDILHIPIDRSVAQNLPEGVARRIKGICIGRQSARDLIVAVSVPDADAYQQVAYSVGSYSQPILVRAEERAIALASEFVYEIPASERHLTWQEWLVKRRITGDTTHPADACADVRRRALDLLHRHVRLPLERSPNVTMDSGEDEVVVQFMVDDLLYVFTLTAHARGQAPLSHNELEALADLVVVARVGRQFTRGEAGVSGLQTLVVAEIEILAVEKQPDTRRDDPLADEPPTRGSRCYVHYRKLSREAVNRVGPQGQSRELREGLVARMYLRSSKAQSATWHLLEPNGWSTVLQGNGG